MANISLQGKEDLRYTFMELWKYKDSTIETLSILQYAENCKDVQSFSFRGEVEDILNSLLLVDGEKLKSIVGGKNIRNIRLFERLSAARAIVSIENPERPESRTVLVKVFNVGNKEYDHFIGDRFRVPASLLTDTNMRLLDTITLGAPYFSLEHPESRKTGLDLCIPISKNADNDTVEVVSYKHEKNIGTIKTIKHVSPRDIQRINNSIKSALYKTALVIGTEKLSTIFELPIGSILVGFKLDEFDLNNNPNNSLKVKSIGTDATIDYEDFLDSELTLIEDIFDHIVYGSRPELGKEKFENIFFNRELPLSLRLFNKERATNTSPGHINSDEARRIQAIIDSMA